MNISGFQDHKSWKSELGEGKVLGKGRVGWVGIEICRFPGPQMKVGERVVKVKGVGKGKFGLGGD